jgi:hypothetical protein
VQVTVSQYSWAMRLLTWGQALHLEHHDFPQIACRRLPLLRKIAPEYYSAPNIKRFSCFFEPWLETLFPDPRNPPIYAGCHPPSDRQQILTVRLQRSRCGHGPGALKHSPAGPSDDAVLVVKDERSLQRVQPAQCGLQHDLRHEKQRTGCCGTRGEKVSDDVLECALEPEAVSRVRTTGAGEQDGGRSWSESGCEAEVGVGLTLRVYQGQVVVTGLVPGGVAEVSGAVRVGHVVLAIDGQEFSQSQKTLRASDAAAIQQALLGPAGSWVSLALTGSSTTPHALRTRRLTLERSRLEEKRRRAEARACEGGGAVRAATEGRVAVEEMLPDALVMADESSAVRVRPLSPRLCEDVGELAEAAANSCGIGLANGGVGNGGVETGSNERQVIGKPLECSKALECSPSISVTLMETVCNSLSSVCTPSPRNTMLIPPSPPPFRHPTLGTPLPCLFASYPLRRWL